MNKIIETPDGFDIEVNGRRYGTWRSREEAGVAITVQELRDERNQKKHFEFLDALRLDGRINMIGAAPYLQEAFPALGRARAREVLSAWMDAVNQRNPMSDGE